MAITSLDQALSGMQQPWSFCKATTPTLVAGRPASLWYLAGAPGAGAGPLVTTAGGIALSSSGVGYASNIAGQIPHQDPGAGNSYLSRLEATATQSGVLMLCDRLLHDGATSGGAQISVTTTGAQTINTTTLPARDNNGATAGVGVLAGLEITGATGSGAATPSIGYTAAGGATGHTAALVDTYVASSAVGAFYRFGLAAGDTGISQITSLTLGVSMTSGTITLVLYRPIAFLELPGALIPNAIDALTGGFPQLFNGVVPFMIFLPNTTTASFISGIFSETQG